jgi:hypothetical protein
MNVTEPHLKYHTERMVHMAQNSYTVVRGQGRQKIKILKIKIEILRKLFFQKKVFCMVKKRILKNIPYFWNLLNSILLF